MRIREARNPAMAALRIGALTIKVRNIRAEFVSLGNATTLATLFAIHPHHIPLSLINQRAIMPQGTVYLYS